MNININAHAKKLMVKAPITGSINIQVPFDCVLEKMIEDKIISFLENFDIKGFKIGGYIEINGKQVDL